MLAALLLAIVGVPLIFLARVWLAEAGDQRLVQRLIDLAVRDPEAARRLLREHPELVQARYVHDETPLHYCAVEGLQDGVRFLAGAGVPIDARNRFGDTALMDTVSQGKLDMTRLLLFHGADPNVASWPRGPALHVAVRQGNAPLAAALLDAGARADYVTDLGERVWDAVPRGEPQRWEMVKVLEAHGVRQSG